MSINFTGRIHVLAGLIAFWGGLRAAQAGNALLSDPECLRNLASSAQAMQSDLNGFGKLSDDMLKYSKKVGDAKIDYKHRADFDDLLSTDDSKSEKDLSRGRKAEDVQESRRKVTLEALDAIEFIQGDVLTHLAKNQWKTGADCHFTGADFENYFKTLDEQKDMRAYLKKVNFEATLNEARKLSERIQTYIPKDAPGSNAAKKHQS